MLRKQEHKTGRFQSSSNGTKTYQDLDLVGLGVTWPLQTAPRPSSAISTRTSALRRVDVAGGTGHACFLVQTEALDKLLSVQ